jgi:hypothetical protein
VVALSHAGPEWWVMTLFAGFGGGVALAVAVLLLLRWRQHLRALQLDPEQLLPPTDATTPEAAATKPTNLTTTPDQGFSEPVRDADYAGLFAPPRPGAAAVQARPPAQPQPTAEAGVPADHEIWAPPEDQGDR